MRVEKHIRAGVILGVVLYPIFRSLPISISAFLSSFLIDLDHVLECYINFGKVFSIEKTIKICEKGKLKKAHLFLHSYELLLIYVLALYWLKLAGIWLGIGIGLTVHLILDALVNCYYSNSLFFVVRWQKGFKYSKIIDIKAQLKRHGEY